MSRAIPRSLFEAIAAAQQRAPRGLADDFLGPLAYIATSRRIRMPPTLFIMASVERKMLLMTMPLMTLRCLRHLSRLMIRAERRAAGSMAISAFLSPISHATLSRRQEAIIGDAAEIRFDAPAAETGLGRRPLYGADAPC